MSDLDRMRKELDFFTFLRIIERDYGMAIHFQTFSLQRLKELKSKTEELIAIYEAEDNPNVWRIVKEER